MRRIHGEGSRLGAVPVVGRTQSAGARDVRGLDPIPMNGPGRNARVVVARDRTDIGQHRGLGGNRRSGPQHLISIGPSHPAPGHFDPVGIRAVRGLQRSRGDGRAGQIRADGHDGPGTGNRNRDRRPGDRASAGVAAPAIERGVGIGGGHDGHVRTRRKPAAAWIDRAVAGAQVEPVVGGPRPGQGRVVRQRQRHVGCADRHEVVAGHRPATANVLRRTHGQGRVGDELAQGRVVVGGLRPRAGARVGRGHRQHHLRRGEPGHERSRAIHRLGGDGAVGVALHVAAPAGENGMGVGRGGHDHGRSGVVPTAGGRDGAGTAGPGLQQVVRLPGPVQRGVVGEGQRHVGRVDRREGVAGHRSAAADVLRASRRHRRIDDELAQGRSVVGGLRPRTGPRVGRGHRQHHLRRGKPGHERPSAIHRLGGCRTVRVALHVAAPTGEHRVGVRHGRHDDSGTRFVPAARGRNRARTARSGLEQVVRLP